MAWTQKEKKEFRLTLQGVYRSYSSLETFVADELSLNLATVSAKENNLEKVAFDLIEYAEARGKLKALYVAFHRDNPGHPFRVSTKKVPRKAPSSTPVPVLEPSLISRARFLKYGGAGVAGIITTVLFEIGRASCRERV